jgi:hypothetical protein
VFICAPIFLPITIPSPQKEFPAILAVRDGGTKESSIGYRMRVLEENENIDTSALALSGGILHGTPTPSHPNPNSK